MRFGLFGSATARHGGPDVDSGQGYKQFVEYNIEAEALGYHSTFLVEHHFTGFGQVSASLSLLTWVAAKTKTLRLGTAVLVLPWHNPVLVAEQAGDHRSAVRRPARFRRRQRLSAQRIRRLLRADRGSRCALQRIARRDREILDLEAALFAPRQILEFRRHHRRAADRAKAASADLDGRRQPGLRSARSPRAATTCCSISSRRSKRSPSASPSSRPRWKSAAASSIRYEVGVARAFYVAKDAADKEAALERRMEAQRRLAAISNPPGGTRAKRASWHSPTPAKRARKARSTARPTRSPRKLDKLRKLGVEYVLLNGGGLVAATACAASPAR